MTHYSRLCKIVIDVPQEVHGQELAFWQAATGQEMRQPDQYPEYHGAQLPGQEVGLIIQRIGGGQSRVHVDIHTDDMEAEISRLEALGAKREFKAHTWWVMSDPAGLLFCVIPDKPGSLHDRNAQRWD
ncbi:MAG: glyoxalase/bleomycin resistance/dioxygenase family protein [Nocardiopsaceae bacterium]|nr:glyoxalase/bleomycin resistance/dioxygenase family protein [Nocardiopsaceae bacterium]